MKRRIVLLLSAALAACAAVWMALHDKGDGRVPESASTAVVQSVASPSKLAPAPNVPTAAQAPKPMTLPEKVPENCADASGRVRRTVFPAPGTTLGDLRAAIAGAGGEALGWNPEGGYDAMVNYECLMIQANKELEQQGKETLYVVYPYDGLSLADSPLGYVDNGDDGAEKLFLKLQEYLLSEDVQNRIQQTGRRSGYSGISEENKDVFRADWGLQPDRVLSPIRMPAANVIEESLNLYQTDFKKPSLSVYCLDYSGSMEGEGNKQLVAAMEQLLIQENARENYLQASEEEINILIPFNEDVIDVYTAAGNGAEIENLYDTVREQTVGGGTDMYQAAVEGMDMLKKYDLTQYTPAIILLTDGQSDGSVKKFREAYDQLNANIPVFSIMFGDADESQLQKVAEYTNARVFDGREDLTEAFRSVRGYN